MIVLDANILIRAVLGTRVRQILELYSGKGVRFCAPESAYAEAERHLPGLSTKRGAAIEEFATTLAYVRTLVEPVEQDTYRSFEEEARRRIKLRDEDDWHVLAAALSLACPIWTEDRDFFGAGVPVWTTDRIEIFLGSQVQGVNQGPRTD